MHRGSAAVTLGSLDARVLGSSRGHSRFPRGKGFATGDLGEPGRCAHVCLNFSAPKNAADLGDSSETLTGPRNPRTPVTDLSRLSFPLSRIFYNYRDSIRSPMIPISETHYPEDIPLTPTTPEISNSSLLYLFNIAFNLVHGYYPSL